MRPNEAARGRFPTCGQAKSYGRQIHHKYDTEVEWELCKLCTRMWSESDPAEVCRCRGGSMVPSVCSRVSYCIS